MARTLAEDLCGTGLSAASAELIAANILAAEEAQGTAVEKTGDTMTGPLNIVQAANGLKEWLAKYDTGSGHSDAPTTLVNGTYLQVGGREFGNNSYRGIGYGYLQSPGQAPPVWAGIKETNPADATAGGFLIATRNTTGNNDVPIDRFEVTSTGQVVSYGEFDVLQNVAGIKTRLAMKLPGTQNDAPTTFGIAATYLGIGGGEWNTNSYRLIGFGYIAAVGNQYPAVIGYQETSITSNTRGDLVFGARANNNNEAPPILLRIRSDGQIMAESATYVPTQPKSLVPKDYVDSPVTKQPAPAATTNTATLTAAELLTGIISGTPTAAAIYTLPTGALLETALLAIHPGLANDDAFDFSVINHGAAGFTITLAGAAGFVVTGGGSRIVQDSTTATSAGRFRVRRTGANAYQLYRLA